MGKQIDYISTLFQRQTDEMAKITSKQWEYLESLIKRSDVAAWRDQSKCPCGGVREYSYHIYWKCRTCAEWHRSQV